MKSKKIFKRVEGL